MSEESLLKTNFLHSILDILLEILDLTDTDISSVTTMFILEAYERILQHC